MEDINIGVGPTNQQVILSAELRRTTHMHVIGGTGTGKSKFLESIMRKDIRSGQGFCLLDWHGTLYYDVLRYGQQLGVGLDNDFRKLILVDASRPEFVTGFNPFVNAGADLSTTVSRRVKAMVKPWGVSNTNEMPTFEYIASLLFSFMGETGETLPNAANLLDPMNSALREYAITVSKDEYTRRRWQRLQLIKSVRDWEEKVLSTENRLRRFIGSTGVRRFMGMNTNNLDLMEAMDKGHIVLINLGASEYLEEEAGRVFASLLLYEFMHTAMRRAQRSITGKKPKPFVLYLDEFQEYITDDIAAMLDQVRKGGLHLVLAHQHLGHFIDNPKLAKSIFTNARIRAVFGGLGYEDSCSLGNEMFLPDLNARQIKKAYYHTIHLYSEQTRLHKSETVGIGTSTASGVADGQTQGKSASSARGHSEGIGIGISSTAASAGSQSQSLGLPSDALSGIGGAVEGWLSQGESSAASESFTSSSSQFSADTYVAAEGKVSSTSKSSSQVQGASSQNSHSQTIVPVWVPIPVQELGSESEWGREEKLSKIAEILKCQQQRHCFIKMDTEMTQPLFVPFVKSFCPSEELLLEYEREVYEAQGALPAAEVDRIIETGLQQFLTKVAEPPSAESPGQSRRKTSRPKSDETPWDDLYNNQK